MKPTTVFTSSGEKARAILPSLVRRSHEEFCTVSRTVMLGADVTATIE